MNKLLALRSTQSSAPLLTFPTRVIDEGEAGGAAGAGPPPCNGDAGRLGGGSELLY